MSAWFELDSPETMHADAAVVDARLPRVTPRSAYTDLYAGYPTDLPKREIEITEAAQRIANALAPAPGLASTPSAELSVGSTTQWKLSPQAQEPPALGLSMVKPCFSMVSTKSIIAPLR